MLIEQGKEFDRKLAEQGKEFDRKLAEMDKRIDRRFDRTTKVLIRALEDRIRALEGRWGKKNELAVRKGMLAILSEEFNAKVKHWHYRRRITAIHPRRKEYELDIIISDGKIIVIEIKGSIYREQVEAFIDNVRAYEYVKKCKVDRKIMIAPYYIDIYAEETAKENGIELMTPPVEYYEREIDEEEYKGTEDVFT